MALFTHAETYRELVELYSQRPPEVLGAVVMEQAWWLLDTTDISGDNGCQYCLEVADGVDKHTVEVCEHYECLSNTIMPAIGELWEAVGYKRWGLDITTPSYLYEPDWQTLDDGFFAVPDPRGIEEMSYWRKSTTKKGSRRPATAGPSRRATYPTICRGRSPKTPTSEPT
jgi:hypothetical protein